VNQLDVSIQTSANLIAQAVDLLLEEQKGRVFLFAGAHLPPLPGALQKEKEKRSDKDAEKDNDPNFHRIQVLKNKEAKLKNFPPIYQKSIPASMEKNLCRGSFLLFNRILNPKGLPLTYGYRFHTIPPEALSVESSGAIGISYPSKILKRRFR
jgi:hypothetical protein